MKKTIFFCLLICCMVFAVGAREFTVESFEADPSDLSARTDAVNDLNGNMCALIRVALPNDGGKFQGNVLKQDFYINEYRVYVSKGTKYLQLLYPGMETLKIDLSQYIDGQGVESGMTYRLKLSGYAEPSTGVQPQQNTIKGNYLSLDVTPKTGVMVEIDGNLQNVDSWPYSLFLEFGQHQLTVKAADYAPYTETITIGTSGKTVKNVTLESILGTLNIKSATPGVSISVNGKDVGTDSYSASVSPDTYLVEAEKEGFRKYSERVTVGEKEVKEFTIQAVESTGEYLVLDVTPQNGTVVEIDGKLQELKNGQLSLFMDFGQHQISVKSPGYTPYNETVTVSRGSKVQRSIKLESILANLKINSATPGVTIKINGKEKGTGGYTDNLTPGSYLVEVEKTGYRPYSQTIDLREKEKRTLDIPALQPIYANLDVAYTPAGATITIDGKTVGTTPEVLFDVLVGPHTVTISKDGYIPYTANVTLKEGQPTKLEGILQKDDHKINDHEAVDLGLSVKWATCNVGASKPSDYGNYYAWGETKTKSTYTSDNSVTRGKSMKDIGGTQYDVAHTEWGGSWRLPTKAECQELIDKCKWVWTTLDGHAGYKVTGPTGNSIFLPDVGYRGDDFTNCLRWNGTYWSSTSGLYAYSAWELNFFDGNLIMHITGREFGGAVRPVIE